MLLLVDDADEEVDRCRETRAVRLMLAGASLDGERAEDLKKREEEEEEEAGEAEEKEEEEVKRDKQATQELRPVE